MNITYRFHRRRNPLLHHLPQPPVLGPRLKEKIQYEYINIILRTYSKEIFLSARHHPTRTQSTKKGSLNSILKKDFFPPREMMSSIINSQHVKWAAAAGSRKNRRVEWHPWRQRAPVREKIKRRILLIMNSSRNSWWDVEDVIILHLRLLP